MHSLILIGAYFYHYSYNFQIWQLAGFLCIYLQLAHQNADVCILGSLLYPYFLKPAEAAEGGSTYVPVIIIALSPPR